MFHSFLYIFCSVKQWPHISLEIIIFLKKTKHWIGDIIFVTTALMFKRKSGEGRGCVWHVIAARRKFNTRVGGADKSGFGRLEPQQKEGWGECKKKLQEHIYTYKYIHIYLHTHTRRVICVNSAKVGSECHIKMQTSWKETKDRPCPSFPVIWTVQIHFETSRKICSILRTTDKLS